MGISAWIRKRQRGNADDMVAFGTALVSLTTQVPRPTERRADPRVLPFLPIARIEHAGGAELCRIRNISAGGLMAEAVTTPSAGAAVTIEIDSGCRLPGTVAWIREDNVGIRFDSRVDLRALFSGERPRIGYRPRPPRLDMKCRATVRLGGVYHHVDVEDVSAGGIKLRLSLAKAAGRKAVVAIEGMTPVRGQVRWSKDGMTGIAFDRMIPFEELVRWMAKRIDVAAVSASVKAKSG